jgi:hypothetical protein
MNLGLVIVIAIVVIVLVLMVRSLQAGGTSVSSANALDALDKSMGEQSTGATRKTPQSGQCYTCGKKLGFPGGSFVGGGDSLTKMLESSPYACRSCGTEFCVDHMRRITNGSRMCPYCGKDVGWGRT